MPAWLIAAIERLPQRARRVAVAATALLVLAGTITSLTLQAGRGREAGRSAVTVRAPARRPAAQTMAPRLRPPVSGSSLRLASRVARRFLLSYLQFAYGGARATSVEAVTPGLRSELMRDRARVTPAERARDPRVVSLRVLGTNPGFVLATASVEDGGIAAYRLRFALREAGGRWLVRDVQEG
ncbi:MAG: hypothetical protein ACYC91_19030 [Solirubrobacteraceae bacterium]